ncbi:MAG: AAA family ATPase [Bacilli bacterium]|nr:AAA family ATPase [Bacilli bacterium]
MLLGQSDFKLQVTKGVYIDKTDIIDELSEKIDTASGIVINRPRRFGKTLMLSTLDYFFSDRYDSLSLFKDLKIGRSPNLRHINKYPVIRLSFKQISTFESESILLEIKKLLASLYEERKEPLYPSLSSSEKAFYDDILALKASNEDFAKALNFLASCYEKYRRKKPIILIDEYDGPIEKTFDSPFYDGVLSFLRSLYVATFKDTNNFCFALLTGVFSLAKGTLGSGLNNLPVDNALVKTLKKNYFGFDDGEMASLQKQFCLTPMEMKSIKENYGGYLFAGESVYNPWSVLNYLNSRQFGEYWSGSGSNETFVKVLGKTDFLEGKLFLSLMGEGEFMHLDLSSSYGTIYQSEDNIALYLVMAGYFSARQIDIGEYFVYSPNRETKKAFSFEIAKRHKDTGELLIAKKIKLAILEGNEESLAHYLKDYVLSSLSYYDFGNEREYQIMVGTLLSVLFSDCLVKYEVIAGTGRCNIMVSPINERCFGFVIETKFHKDRLSSSRLTSSASSALGQIKKHDYAQELFRRNASPIYAYGLAFYKNNVAVRFEKLRD